MVLGLGVSPAGGTHLARAGVTSQQKVDATLSNSPHYSAVGKNSGFSGKQPSSSIFIRNLILEVVWGALYSEMRSSDPHSCACRATYFTTGEGEPGHPKESPEKGMKPSSDHSEEPRTLRAHSILHRSSWPLNVTSEISLSSAWPWPRVTSQKTQGALATLVLLDP